MLYHHSRLPSFKVRALTATPKEPSAYIPERHKPVCAGVGPAYHYALRFLVSSQGHNKPPAGHRRMMVGAAATDAEAAPDSLHK